MMMITMMMIIIIIITIAVVVSYRDIEAQLNNTNIASYMCVRACVDPCMRACIRNIETELSIHNHHSSHRLCLLGDVKFY